MIDKEEQWCWGLYFLGVEKGQRLVVKLLHDRFQNVPWRIKNMILILDKYVLVVTQPTNGLTFKFHTKFSIRILTWTT